MSDKFINFYNNYCRYNYINNNFLLVDNLKIWKRIEIEKRKVMNRDSRRKHS